MNARRWAAIAIVAVAAIALVVLHFVGSSPATTSTLAVAPSALATTVASDAPTATSSALASIAPSGSPSPTPVPAPTQTGNANLLSAINGAFVRSWTAGGLQSDPQVLPEDDGSIAVEPTFRGPVRLLYELPAIAHLDSIAVSLRGQKPARVDVSVGTDVHALHDVGAVPIVLPADSDVQRTVAVAADVRYVRLTVTRTTNAPLRIATVTATGTAGAPQTGKLDGFWVNLASTSSAVQFGGMRGRVPDVAPPVDRNDDQRAAVEEDGHYALFRCRDRFDPWEATLDGSVARGGAGAVRLAGNGNMLVGFDGNRPVIAMRVKALPACGSSTAGSGPVVAAFVRVLGEETPEIAPSAFPRRRFETHFAPLMTASQLQRARFAVLEGDCSASIDLSPRRQKLLLDWVAAGHKLIIRDADMCPSSSYAFVPFHFTTQANGRAGKRGKTLALADPSTLGATRSDPRHFLDVDAYLASKDQQIGDGDVMKTDDPHWCGHLFAINAHNAKGWVHAYARYGRGLIIYDGFDHDDVIAAIPAALRLVEMEYAQPAQADLPCNARVASKLALYPSIDRALPAGKAVAVRVPMQLVSTADTSASQDVELSIEGDARYAARVTPARVRLSGSGSHVVAATVSLPNGWSGSHAYTVAARGAYGASAEATILIDGSVALAKAFESQRRVRLYGIHFDVASARIQPVSEATIAQIAQVLAVHSDWTMRVEGHTDSDGGATYNLDLSLHRAHAVVDDLVARYHVRRAPGFGLTKPVASNATEGGKALNRRVELVRL